MSVCVCVCEGNQCKRAVGTKLLITKTKKINGHTHTHTQTQRQGDRHTQARARTLGQPQFKLTMAQLMCYTLYPATPLGVVRCDKMPRLPHK